MILPPNHFIVFNSEIKNLMERRSYNFKKSIQETLDETLETLLDCPLKLSHITLPE